MQFRISKFQMTSCNINITPLNNLKNHPILFHLASFALGIQSPSENGNGTKIPCWGCDYPPQSSFDKVIGSIGHFQGCFFWFLGEEKAGSVFGWRLRYEKLLMVKTFRSFPYGEGVMKSGRRDSRELLVGTWFSMHNLLGGGFKDFFIFTPILGRFAIWLIFFKGVETTN